MKRLSLAGARPRHVRWVPAPAKPALRSGPMFPLLRASQRQRTTARTAVASSRALVRMTAQTAAARRRRLHPASRLAQRFGTFPVWPKQSTQKCRIVRRAEAPGCRRSFAAPYWKRLRCRERCQRFLGPRAMPRSISRWASRFFTSSRRSYSCLPWTKASSTLTRPSFS